MLDSSIDDIKKMKKDGHPDIVFNSNPWGFRAQEYATVAAQLPNAFWDAIYAKARSTSSVGDADEGDQGVADGAGEEASSRRSALRIGWCVHSCF